jgi:general secretion pathway protein I
VSRSIDLSARGREGGFSLLEVLVAFVILSLVATALFRLFSGALNNASAAEDYSRAVLVAQSALDNAAVGPLKETTASGDAEDGRVHWSVAVAAWQPPDTSPDLERLSSTLPTRLYRITATSSFVGANGAERRVTLSTVRLGAREATTP